MQKPANPSLNSDDRKGQSHLTGAPGGLIYRQWLRLALRALILMVGAHSIVLGIAIYFATDGFYRLFFNASVENLFFVRQSGLFLILMGMFYLVPLRDPEKYRAIIILTIVTKLLAVVFMIANAGHTPAPGMILLAAAGDGAMAFALIFLTATGTSRGMAGRPAAGEGTWSRQRI